VWDIKHLARLKCRFRRRGTPPRRDADCGSQRRVAAAGAALRLAAMQFAHHSGVFFVCVPAPHQEFSGGSKHKESRVY